MLHRLYKSPATTYAPPVGVSEPLIQNATHVVEDVLPEMMISSTTYYISIAVLCIYVFSIVFGRIYTGMHSLTDCTFGVVLGVAIWGIYVFIGDWINLWLRTSGWIGQFIIFLCHVPKSHRNEYKQLRLLSYRPLFFWFTDILSRWTIARVSRTRSRSWQSSWASTSRDGS